MDLTGIIMVINDTRLYVEQLRAEIQALKDENANLLSEIHFLREKDSERKE